MSRFKPRSPEGERGFALSEVLIAILIIGAALLTLLASSAASFTLQQRARERQTAVGIANEVMEEVRTLDYTVVRAGTFEGVSTQQGDPTHVVDCGGEQLLRNFKSSDPCASGDGLGEVLVASPSGTGACLPAVGVDQLAGKRPLVPNCTEYQIDGVEYRAFVFITEAQLKLDLYRISVIVDWPYVAPPGESPNRVILQSLFGQNAGCGGKLIDSLLQGPCGNGSQRFLDVPAPTMTVGYDATHVISIDLGGVQLSWDEPAGERSITAEFLQPLLTVNGAAIDLGEMSGIPLLERDSLLSTDTPDTGPSQFVGFAINTGGVTPTATNPYPLAYTQIPNTTLWVVLEWRASPHAGCGDSLSLPLPSGSAWFACAELDVEASAGQASASLHLPVLDFCVNTVKDACPTADAAKPIVASLSGRDTIDTSEPHLSAAMDAASTTKTLEARFGVGDGEALTGGTLTFPTYPLLRYMTTTDWTGLRWNGQKLPTAGKTKPSGCFHSASITPSDWETGYSAKCLYKRLAAGGTAFQLLSPTLVDPGANRWSIGWIWRFCPTPPGGNWAISGCVLKIPFAPGAVSTLQVTLETGSDPVVDTDTGTGW